MFDTSKYIDIEDNPLYKWSGASTAITQIEIAGATERKGAIDVVHKIKYRRYQKAMMFAIVDASSGGKDDYFCLLDFVAGKVSCECQAFARRQGLCKHIIAVLADGLSIYENQEKTAAQWIDQIITEARNAGSRKPWERKPSFDASVAEAYGATVGSLEKRGKTVMHYVMDDGLLWTGPLPIPEIGKKCTLRLPTGEKVGCEVLNALVDGAYRALSVRLDADSETIKALKAGSTMEAYGAEIENNE